MSFKESIGKLFGHENKPAETQPTTAPSEVTAPAVDTAPVAPVAEVTPANPEVVAEPSFDEKVAAALGSAGTELSNEVAAATENGTLDTVPESAPASDDVALAEIASLPQVETPEASDTSEETATYEIPTTESQSVETAPTDTQAELPAEISGQSVVEFPNASAPTEEAPVVTIEDTTADPASDDLWKELDTNGANAPSSASPEQSQS